MQFGNLKDAPNICAPFARDAATGAVQVRARREAADTHRCSVSQCLATADRDTCNGLYVFWSASSMSDGGRHALAGYLYQMLGYYTLIASTRDVSSSEDSFDFTLGFQSLQEARHEAYGQDALLSGVGRTGTERALLVQFKYSSRPHEVITRPDLFAIAEKLVASADSASELMGKDVGYRIVTNRKLNAKAHRALQQPEEVSTTNHDKRLPETLGRLRHHLLDEDAILRNLRSYASELGVLDREFEDGIDRLVGRLLRTTASMQTWAITRADVAKGLCNFEEPRSLAGSEIAELLRDETASFRRGARLPETLIRRKIMGRIERSFDRPLIVLHGDGGCGKTAAVYSIVDEALNGDDTFRFFVRMDLARLISRDWISTTVSEWRGASSEWHSDSAKRAIERLEKAHGSKGRPILLMLLDGLDEARHYGMGVAEAIRATFKFCHDEYLLSQRTSSSPRVVVVATCRVPEDLDEIWMAPIKDCRIEIPVEDFSRKELLSAAADALPPSLGARFAASAQSTGDESEYSDSHFTVSSYVLTAMPAKEEILEALEHPLLWGLFCLLPDEQTQHAVLDGERASLNDLCESYILEFSRKAQARTGEYRAVKPEPMLRAVAVSSTKLIGLRKAKDWVEPLVTKGLFSERDAELLFEEALSFGLVASDGSGIWRWRHAMVQKYLSNEGASEV